MIAHIHSEPRWTERLASVLEQAQSGDIIVVADYAMLDLTLAAAKRLNKWPSVRIMTEETYQEISPMVSS